jgi:hypothetical protein
MNKSDYMVGFLNANTQRAYAENQEGEKPTTDEKPKTPPTEQVALLRRIRKVVFGPSVKDIATALDRFNAIVDSLDDSEDDDDEKQAPKQADKV